MIKLIILLLITDCVNSTSNTTNKKIEDRGALKKERSLSINNSENKKEENTNSKTTQNNLVLTFDEITQKIKDKKLEEEELKTFLVKNYVYLNEILKHSLTYDNAMALKFLLKNYSINDFDLSLALEKYFESDDSNDIYTDYVINYFKFRNLNFFDIFIDKIKTLKDDKTTKIDNLIQKILKVNNLFDEDIKNLFKASIDKISEETLSILAEELITNDVKLKVFKDLYNNSKNDKFFNSFLNVILNKNIIGEILKFILNDPLNENFDKITSNENFKKSFQELNKSSEENLKLINEYIKDYLENSYEKAEKIVNTFISRTLLKLEDVEFNRFYKENQNKENIQKLLEFCFISKVPEKNLENSWNTYIKLRLDKELNFKLFKKFYEKSPEKSNFLSNRISKTIYSSFEVEVINFALEKNISFDDKILAIIFKNTISFFRDKKELNLLPLKVAETILDKIKDFNSKYDNNKIGEELILILYTKLVLGHISSLNKDEIKNFLNKIVKIYSDKGVELSPLYKEHLEKIKEKFVIK